MPSNALAMQKAGPITSAGWSRLQPHAIQAPTLGMAALVVSDHLKSLRQQLCPFGPAA
jgi:hypothetical protein